MDNIAKNNLQNIANILIINGTLSDCPGLLHGKTGIAIFFFHYSRYTDNSLFEDYAMDLIEEIQHQIHNNSPADYRRGIAGIGAGINYLVNNGFLQANDDLFDDFDYRMYQAVMHDPYIDFSLYNGIIGYGYYWINRLSQQKKHTDETITYILHLIESNFKKVSLRELQDIYYFLQDISGFPNYIDEAGWLITKIQDMRIETDKLLRMNESPFNIHVNEFKKGNNYFRKSHLLHKVKLSESTEEMGLYNGLTGYALFLLSDLSSESPEWINLF